MPDIADRHRRHVALAMLAVALMSAANAAETIVPLELIRAAKWVQVAAALAMGAAIVPMLWWKLRNRSATLRHLYLNEDGFAAKSLEQAKSISWVVTFVFLSGLPVATRRFDSIPADFFLYLATALMLGVFAGVFLFLTRDSADVPSDSADA